jgi:hypothetical protein
MRTTTRWSLFAALLACFAGVSGVTAQTVPVDIEVGYRFVNVSGNEDMYRSQVNEREGFLLRSLYLSTTDFGGSTGLLDHLRLSASDFGVGPNGGLRLDLGKAEAYKLRLTYRRSSLFSALPAFANPLLADGIVPGEQTYDRVRNTLDLDLELLPGRIITPIIGYTRNTYSGPGRTTYHVGEDEFRLAQDLSDRDQEVRVGAAFDAGPVTGRIVQGWRKFEETETLRLVPGAGDGNNVNPVLGLPVSVSDYTRKSGADVNTPVTSAFVRAEVGPRVRLIGSYVYAKDSADASDNEDVSGSLVSFQISRFFGGLSEQTSSQAQTKLWNGTGRVEVNLAPGIDVTAGYTQRHRELDGFALVSSLYTDTVTFAGADPKDLLKILQADNSLDRTEKIFEANASVRRLGPVALTVGFAHNKQDVTVSPDMSEIVVPGSQGGDFERTIKSFRAGAVYSQSGLMFGADYLRERADDPVVRTDFLDRDRYRVRAGWKHGELVRVGLNAEQIDSSNDRTGIGYDGRIRQYGGDLDVAPIKALHLRFDAAKYEADSKVLIRQPQDFSTESSIHSEGGRTIDGSFSLSLSPVTIEAGYGNFKNTGTFPFSIDRAHARAEFAFNASTSLIGEWDKDKYSEQSAVLPPWGDYDANRYGVFVRWKQ